MILLYNFCHNLGNVYDLTEEGIKRSIDFEHNWSDPEFWARIGFILGANVQNIFERPDGWHDYNEATDGPRV